MVCRNRFVWFVDVVLASDVIALYTRYPLSPQYIKHFLYKNDQSFSLK